MPHCSIPRTNTLSSAPPPIAFCIHPATDLMYLIAQFSISDILLAYKFKYNKLFKDTKWSILLMLLFSKLSNFKFSSPSNNGICGKSKLFK